MDAAPRAHRAATNVAVGDATTLVARTGSDARLHSLEAATATPQRAVSPRAVIIGLLCAAFLCAITPYNDFNTH